MDAAPPAALDVNGPPGGGPDGTQMSTPDLEIHYDPDGDWAALYVNGVLDRVGDAYRTEERALEVLGVTTVQDNAFLRGGDGVGQPAVARTLTEVAEYRTERERRREEAERLRAEAQALLEQAGDLDRR